MVTTNNQPSHQPAQDDPGESNDFMSALGGFDVHVWTTLNQIFERLGRMDQKLDNITHDQKLLGESVKKHEN